MEERKQPAGPLNASQEEKQEKSGESALKKVLRKVKDGNWGQPAGDLYQGYQTRGRDDDEVRLRGKAEGAYHQLDGGNGKGGGGGLGGGGKI